MKLARLVYALAMRSDSADNRELGAHFMREICKLGDPELVLGWLVSDWLELVRRHENLDSPQDVSLDSAPRRESAVN